MSMPADPHSLLRPDIRDEGVEECDGWSYRPFVVASIFACFLGAVSPALAAKKTCLSGTDPEVANDAPQIRALRVLVGAICTCGSFDGTPGRKRGDYLECVTKIVDAAVVLGNLRRQCKSVVKKFANQSTCGAVPSLHSAVCIKTILKSGKVSCAIRSTTKKDGTPSYKCIAKPGKFDQVVCPDFSFCIDAADTNDDLAIADPGDNGQCRATPTASPNSPATPTVTSDPSATPALTATPTSTTTPAAGPTPTATATSAGNVTPTPTGTPTIVATTTTSPTATPEPRFVDNGDGTVTDTATGLQWEKKTTSVNSGQNYSDPHDVDNTYYREPFPWTVTTTDLFLSGLNSPPCFAGHCDWRLPKSNGRPDLGFPSAEPAELESILLSPYVCSTSPCIDPVFGPTIVQGLYWSASSVAFNPGVYWAVNFSDGNIGGLVASYDFSVRAVRTAGP